MTVGGRVQVRLEAECGWFDEFVWVNYSVAAPDNASRTQVRRLTESQYDHLAEVYHDQHCGCDCNTYTTFLWDTEDVAADASQS